MDKDDSSKRFVPLTFTLTASKSAQLCTRDRLLVENLELIELGIPQLVPPPPRLVKVVALQCQNCRSSNQCRTLSHVRKWDGDIQHFLPHLAECQATSKQVRNILRKCTRKSSNSKRSTRRGDKSLTTGKLSLNEYCDYLVEIYGLKDNRSVVRNNDGSHSLKGITGVTYGPCDYEAEALPSSRHPQPEDALFVNQTPEDEDVELPKANINKNYVLSPIGQEANTLEQEQCSF